MLGQAELAQLVRCCPNLEQLGLALERNNFTLLKILLPFMSKLTAIRILEPVNDPTFRTVVENDGCEKIENMSITLAQSEYRNLRWVGVGDMVFSCLGCYEIKDESNENGGMLQRRVVHRVTLDDVKHIDIWRMDGTDLF